MQYNSTVRLSGMEKRVAYVFKRIDSLTLVRASTNIHRIRKLLCSYLLWHTYTSTYGKKERKHVQYTNTQLVNMIILYWLSACSIHSTEILSTPPLIMRWFVGLFVWEVQFGWKKRENQNGFGCAQNHIVLQREKYPNNGCHFNFFLDLWKSSNKKRNFKKFIVK